MAAREERDPWPRRLVTVALAVAVIAFAVQQTAVVPAIQTIEGDLRTSAEWSAWLLTVYLIVATVATPAMGRLGDLHGRRTLLLIGLSVFAAASVGAALAPNILVLLVFRAVQGIGGAVYPLALALAREQAPDDRAGSLLAILAAAFGVGTALGFVAGGLLAGLASWRWIFWMGAVLVAAAIVLVSKAVPATRDRADGTFDLLGTVLLSAAGVAVLVALTLAVPLGWASPVTAGLLALTLVAAVAWVRVERRTADPLIDLQVLRKRSVIVANLATIGLGWALFGTYLLVPRLAGADPGTAGYGFGYGALGAGLLLLPLAVGQSLASFAAGRLSRHLRTATIFAAGLVIIAAALGILTAVRHNDLALASTMLLFGLGAGAAMETSSVVATEDVSADVAAVSSAVNSTVRRLAGGIGGQVSTALLAALVLSAGTPGFGAFRAAYAVAGGLCVIGAAVVLLGTRRSAA